MTMDQPDTRVIWFEGQGQVAFTVQQSNISPWGVIIVEVFHISRGVEGTVTLCQDYKVMPVQMNRVSRRDLGLVAMVRIADILTGDDQIDVALCEVIYKKSQSHLLQSMQVHAYNRRQHNSRQN